MKPGKFYLHIALLLSAPLFSASCKICTDCEQHEYQCRDSAGNLTNFPQTIEKGEDVYFGELFSDPSGECRRRWVPVNPGGGSSYECRIGGRNNVKASKTQPLTEFWSYGSCGEEGRPTTPVILEISDNGTIRWKASKANAPGNVDGPPDEYFIVLSTFPISEGLFNQKVSSNSHIEFDATANAIEEFTPSISSGTYYVRIRAVSGTQFSNVSTEKAFSLASGAGVTFTPNPIPRSGLTRMKLTLDGSFSGNFSDLELQINSAAIEVNQDYADEKVFYFTPPALTDNNPLDVTINSSGTGIISISGGISVREDNIEETNLVLEGFHVKVEEAYSDVRKAGLTGEPAQEKFLDLIHDYIQPGTVILKELWLERSISADLDKLVNHIFESHNARAEKKVDDLVAELGALASPAEKQAAE